MKYVVFVCEDCKHTNTQEAGMKDYQWKQTEFRSFTDAMAHVVQYAHNVYARTEDEEAE